jgi:hypothetical protein
LSPTARISKILPQDRYQRQRIEHPASLQHNSTLAGILGTVCKVLILRGLRSAFYLLCPQELSCVGDSPGVRFAVAGSDPVVKAVPIPILDYRFVLLRAFRGRPTLRSFTASRSFGSMSHTFPSFVAFKRLAAIILCTLLTVTFNRFAASAAPMIFIEKVYH